MLDERRVGYPDGVEDQHGVIRIIHDHMRHVKESGDEANIMMASFREQDVMEKQCVTPDAALKTVVQQIGAPVSCISRH